MGPVQRMKIEPIEGLLREEKATGSLSRFDCVYTPPQIIERHLDTRMSPSGKGSSH